MKKLLIFIILYSSLAQAKILRANKISDFYNEVIATTEQYGNENVLIVFDIDNTLLTFPDNFGSVQWMKWQKTLFNSNSPHSLADNFEELIYFQMIIYEMRSLVPVEIGTVNYFNALVQSGKNILLHTSRGPLKRNTTEKELLRNLMSPRKSIYLEIPGPRSTATYQNSLYMTEGQNKGVMLKKLLARLNLKPKVILFLDDDMKNITNLENAFKDADIVGHFYHYTYMEPRVNKFNASGKHISIEKGKALTSALKAILK